MTIFTDLFARHSDIDNSIFRVNLCYFLEKCREKTDYQFLKDPRYRTATCILVKLEDGSYLVDLNSSDKKYTLVSPGDIGRVTCLDFQYAIDPKPYNGDGDTLIKRLLLRRKARETVKRIYQRPRQYR